MANIKPSAADQWISVEDRLPQENESVLVWMVDDNSAIGGERREYADVWEYWPGRPYFQLNQGSGVTHWMPLPKPPIAD
jgi:hypothetical protein